VIRDWPMFRLHHFVLAVVPRRFARAGGLTGQRVYCGIRCRFLRTDEAMFRFLHAADIHLDSPLRGLDRYEGAPVERLRGATRRALENLVDLALETPVDFVLIAGDLYDGDWEDFRTGLFFARQAARLDAAGIPMVIVAGNHDAANRMSRRLPLPASTRLLMPGEAQTVRLERLKVAIHGQSFGEQATAENLAAGYPRPVRGWFNIGLLHTSLTGREGHDVYAPCSLDELGAKGYDYWALGHVHRYEVVAEDPVVVFPGNLQGRHIRETGPKGCVLVEVEGRRVRWTFRPMDVVRWEECRVDAQGVEDEADLLERVRQRLAEGTSSAAGRLRAVRVRLEGVTPLHATLVAEQESWTAKVRSLAFQVNPEEVWVEQVAIATRPPLQWNPARWADSPLGELMACVAELQASPDRLAAVMEDKALRDLAARLPAEVRAGANLGLDGPEALRPLLADVEQMLVHALLTKEPSR